MNPVWRLRLAAGLGLSLAIACAVALRPDEVATAQISKAEATKFQAADGPAKTAPLANTGRKPDGAFLVDLKAGFDGETQYMSDYEMDADWIKIAFRPSNVRFQKDGLKLELLRSRGKLPFSGGELQLGGFYGYGRYEAVIRPSGEYGAVSSFFTFTNSNFDDPHDEIDFEFVGKNPRQVHLNYFARGESDPVDVPLGFDASMADHLYAFEWAPDAIRWYVDGRQIHEVKPRAGKPAIPTTTGHVIANIWAGAGQAQGWTGEPRFQVASAMYRCMSHVPMGKTGKQCSDSFSPPPKP